MHRTMTKSLLAVACASALAGCAGMQAIQSGPQHMTFFVTSTNPGDGGNFGGLAGADKHCQALAAAAGAGSRTWRAYLSTQATGGLTDKGYVNARDRIGDGPWQNAKGTVIARNVQELHSMRSALNKETAIDEKGNMVKGRTEKPNEHDILTGSRPDGTAFPGPPFADMTCGNWTKNSKDASGMTGHFDRSGPLDESWARSWNSAHPSRGCDMEGLRSTGGAGLLYCFATN